jgi:hypothetical protein
LFVVARLTLSYLFSGQAVGRRALTPSAAHFIPITDGGRMALRSLAGGLGLFHVRLFFFFDYLIDVAATFVH